MKRALLRIVGKVSLLLWIAQNGMNAAPAPFSLDVESRSSNKISLPVPASGEVIFSLVQSTTSSASTPVDLHLSPFIGDQGNSLTVKLDIPGVSAQAQTDQTAIKVDKMVLPLRLVDVNLPTAGKYNGSLILTQAGADPKIWQIELSRSQVSQTFTLDVQGAENKASLSVPPTKEVNFSLVRSGTTTAPNPIDLHLSQFPSDQGNSLTVKLVVPGVKDTAEIEQTGIQLNNPVLPLRLTEVDLPTADKYTGSLVLTQAGADPKIWQLQLSRVAVFQPAVLVLDQQTLTADVNLPFWFFSTGQNPEFTVRISDKTRQWNLHGITARLEQVAKAPGRGFDLARNVAFQFNHVEAPDFTTSSAKTPRDVTVQDNPPQAEVGLVFQNLEPGEYNGTLRFTATNSAADDLQKLAFVLHVRASVWWAVLMLLVALGVSFVTTKVITILKKRYVLQKKISDLDHDWLRSEPAVLPVVWVRSELLQCRDLSNRFWLSGFDVLDARVTKAGTVVDILDLARQLRLDAEKQPAHLLKIRALAALDRVARDFDPTSLDDTKATALRAKLAELSGWFQRDKREALYWADLSVSINDLLLDVRVPDVPQSGQALVQQLITTLRTALQEVPLDLPGKMEAERNFARLKVLWERSTTTDFTTLATLLAADPQPRLEEFFAAADGLAWKRVKAAKLDNRARIKAPARIGGANLQAFQPLIFEFTTGDPDLDCTYLVLHGLKYSWTFIRDDAMAIFETDGPNAVQYAEDADEFGVVVKIYPTENPADPIELHGARVSVFATTDFAWHKGLERVEIISFCLGAVAALSTGLLTFYFKSPSWGSPQDYLMLFIWGAAVDQTKNALQLLQSYS